MKIQFQWIIALLIASLLIIGASGCQKTAEQAQEQGAKTSENIVKITESSFQPAEITINAGESITWINEDSVVHTASADDITWSLKMISGQNFSKTFDTAGEYPYHCAIHPEMKGKVIVK